MVKFELSEISTAPCGVPQIEVKIDVAANILNVLALTRPLESLTRLLCTRPRFYIAKDEAVSAQNQTSLKSYSYNPQNPSKGDFKDKLEVEKKVKLEKEIDKTISWLDASQEASKDKHNEQQKLFEAIANSIVVSFPD
ncbi:hypothetical protein KEM48_002655 [Puccinia striiformis f. sp. tritici PST-130]|nr:hypothetical protein KEM48_002655 [Puccinia striiformis f. sp. tritici PST-130]KNE99063.1 hypothetical protein PSTG_07714 [Puccinia striiformis f. sp. tritici PST-78]